ncbi:hypothetical protein CV102_24120 [Natronococcus pandeyae]|uniref:DUF2243 domain-containing protein n=1 Tax=Natronococcus pandeyae TaxID=2055836 RepID=A0A8J8PYG3_9EURY|nr:DUF2243 domain-containing protein [Natronococcus pandeyae]TYL36121.1 hypothetical protein CV102_24120 [Natronococcus pandeyae]
MNDRTDAMLNGALMVIGAAAVVDTVVFHWVLEWHRLIEGAPDPELFFLELGVVLVGGILFAVGAARERRARRR